MTHLLLQDPNPVLVLAGNAEETLEHTLDFSSLMFEVKHGPKCSPGLGPVCWTTMMKKIPSKFLICVRNFLSVLKCWGLNENL